MTASALVLRCACLEWQFVDHLAIDLSYMDKLKRRLENFKTLPNKLTIGRIMIIPVILVVYPLTHQFVFPRIFCAILFLLAALTDFLDGYFARKYNHVSKLGALLDPIADKILVASSITILTNAGYLSAFVAGLLLCREIAIGGLRMAALELGFTIEVSELGKVKTAVQDLAFFCLMIYVDFTIPVGHIATVVALGLSYYSAFQYCREFWQNGRSHFLEPDED